MPYSFGSNNFGSKVYGGYDSPFVLSAIPVIVEVYSNALGYRTVFQTGVGDFLGCEFSTGESGSKDFILYFAKIANIRITDIIKIKIFNSDSYFFTGVIRETPAIGSTKAEFNYSGYGLNDYFNLLNAESKNYVNKTIEEILDDLLDNNITPYSPITKNLNKINPPDITIGSFVINYSDMLDVLDTLRKIANSSGTRYMTGVDETGDFFFLPKLNEIERTLVVGKKGKYGIDYYEPEDIVDVITQIYILEDDGTYIDTIENEDVDEDSIQQLTGQYQYYVAGFFVVKQVREIPIDKLRKKKAAPNIDNTAAEELAGGEIKEIDVNYNSRRATVVLKIEEYMPQKLMANGNNIRVINNIPPDTTQAPDPNPYGSGTYGSGLYGGGLYQGIDIIDVLEIKEIKYILTSGESVRQIELGALPPRLEKQINQVSKDISELRISLGR